MYHSAYEAIHIARETKEYRVQSVAELTYVLGCKSLSDAEQRLWQAISIVTAFSESYTANISLQKLSELTGKSIRTTQRLIASLQEKCFLKIRRGEGVTNQITLALPEEGVTFLEQAPTRGKRASLTVVNNPLKNKPIAAIENDIAEDTPDKVDGGTHDKLGICSLYNTNTFTNNENKEYLTEITNNATKVEINAVQDVIFLENEMKNREAENKPDLFSRYDSFLMWVKGENLTPFAQSFQKRLKQEFSNAELMQIQSDLAAKERQNAIRDEKGRGEHAQNPTKITLPKLNDALVSALLQTPVVSKEIISVAIDGIPEKAPIEKDIYEKIMREIPRMYRYGEVHSDLRQQSQKQLITAVCYHVAFSALNSTQLHRYHAARIMIKKGTFGTPKPLANILAVKRELDAIRVQRELENVKYDRQDRDSENMQAA